MIALKSPVSRLTVKVKLRKCAICRAPFEKRSMGHTACSPACAIKVADAKTAKADKAKDKVRAEKLKTIYQLIAEAQTAFNAWVRQRDEFLSCVCCGRFQSDDLRAGHQWDAGHFRSRGSAGHLRFNEDNCHRQLAQCNRGQAKTGNYRTGLVGRIGVDRVEALESNNAVHKWTRDELIAIKHTYRAKLKQLRKEAK